MWDKSDSVPCSRTRGGRLQNNSCYPVLCNHHVALCSAPRGTNRCVGVLQELHVMEKTPCHPHHLLASVHASFSVLRRCDGYRPLGILVTGPSIRVAACSPSAGCWPTAHSRVEEQPCSLSQLVDSEEVSSRWDGLPSVAHGKEARVWSPIGR